MPTSSWSDFAAYQRLAMTTNKVDLSGNNPILNGALGLTGEAGEVADLVKKWCYPSKSGDGIDFHDKMVSELGDVLWYVAALCNGMGISMADVAMHNILKLADRHKMVVTEAL